MEDGQREGGGLAGAGLRDTDNVAAGEREWHGLCLDGGGNGVVFFGKRTRDGLGEAETFKRGQSKTFQHWRQRRPLMKLSDAYRGVIMTPRVFWAAVR